MKYVLFYERGPGFERDKVMALFPAHRAAWKQFQEAGTLLLIGPFTDEPVGAAMSVFTTREAAEAFARQDPFVTNGVVGRWSIREWKEALIPEPAQG
jgi:uncharacterized protein YciI